MLFPTPSKAELRRTFTAILDEIVAGSEWGCPTDSGMDDETANALDALAAQPNPKPPTAIRDCRIVFARQLDGTHRREQEDAL